jgi:hypothetical protein
MIILKVPPDCGFRVEAGVGVADFVAVVVVDDLLQPTNSIASASNITDDNIRNFFMNNCSFSDYWNSL